jgi:hypothetical protein
MNLLDRWTPNMKFETSSIRSNGGGTSIHYSESDDEKTNNKAISFQSDLENANPGTATDSIYSFGPQIATCDMIGKTNSNFNHGKYETLIARFHTNNEASKSSSDPTQSANSKQYGQSHGRNLLKTKVDNPNGYENPYCRVWTYHHQYNQVKRQIRPLTDDDGNILSQERLQDAESKGGGVGFRTIESKTFKFEGGSKRLDRYGVLNYNNGTVNIAPTAKIKDYFEHKQGDYDKNIIETKKCMFSIENLAWRDDKSRRDEFDAYGLSPEQKGPLGGRIMWFPPYNLKFSESVNVNWNPNQFIGRGEKVYTYTDTERKGNLSFTLLIDHPSILDYWTGHERNGMKNGGKQLDPKNVGGVDNIYNQENTLLRFFAGCDILTAKPQEYRRREVKPDVVPEPPKPVEPTPPEPEVHKTTTHKLYAILYYPNNYSGKDDDAEFAINYLMYGVGTQQQIVNGKVERLEPTVNAQYARGYEVRESGISVATWAEISGDTKYGTNGYGAVEGIAEYIGNTIYDDKSVTLAKQIGSTASKGADSTKLTSEWKMKRWYYRVDNSTANQRLVGKPMNYLDQNSYKLNSSGYEWVKKNIQAFNLNDNDDLVSFAELYCALNEEANTSDLGISDTSKVELIKEIFNQDNGIKVKKLVFKGHHSANGRNPKESVNKKRNNDLAKNRSLTFKKWMMVKKFPMADEAEYEGTLTGQTQSLTYRNKSVDDQYIKAWRSASVMIEYEREEKGNAAELEQTKIKTDNGTPITDKDGKVVETAVKTSVPSKNKSNPLVNAVERTVDKDKVWAAYDKANGTNHLNPDDWETFDNSYLQLDNFTQSTVKRYDNEGEFFEALSDKDPFLHHLITDKIRYFDPAYHSISPEGFNARLTFLHQCTRQGSTVGNADTNGVGTTAYNLAFGRPPVCVLRVGDFYYTKIIIDSIQINYDSPQWDMNPEGIGMMPMFADITISFAFLGGSDLGGPIARLQNAVSFNYYANASVYDNRAEKVEYDSEGSGKEINFKGYNYPNMYIGDRFTKGRLTNKDTEDERRMDGIEPDEF